MNSRIIMYYTPVLRMFEEVIILDKIDPLSSINW